MIRSLHIAADGKQAINVPVEDLRKALQTPDCLLWISLERPTEEEARAILVDLFQFHPLAIEDCLNTGYQSPKVDDFGKYIFLIFHALRPADDVAKLETMELNLFLGSNFLVSVHLDDKFPAVDALWTQLARDQRLTQNGSDFLCHSLLDFVVDEYMPLLDQMDDEIDLLEDQVLARPNTRMLERILDLKHKLIYLRRIISPQREVLNRLSRDQFPMIDEMSRIYFRDIYDHMVRYQELIETLRDVTGGAMDIYLNSTSLRLNEVMKALAVVSTIFLPLSFVAGMYGMNFQYMIPNWEWKYGFAVFVIICLAIVFGMLYFFKRRGWF
jgi:magnesium transporter